MLLTQSMAIFGIAAGFFQWTAHRMMRRRTYATPIPRYAVGSFIILCCFAAGWGMEPAQHPVIGLVLTYGTSLIGTWLGYEQDRPVATEKDVDRLLGHVIAEHTNGEGNDQG